MWPSLGSMALGMSIYFENQSFIMLMKNIRKWIKLTLHHSLATFISPNKASPVPRFPAPGVSGWVGGRGAGWGYGRGGTDPGGMVPPCIDRHLWKHYLPATSFAGCNNMWVNALHRNDLNNSKELGIQIHKHFIADAFKFVYVPFKLVFFCYIKSSQSYFKWARYTANGFQN